MLELIGLPFLFLKAAISILGDRKLLYLCIIPYAIGSVSFFLFLWAAFEYRQELTSLLISNSESFWYYLLSWSVLLVNIFLSGLAAILCTLLLGSFFIDLFIEELLRRNHLPLEDCPTISAILRSTLRSLRDDIRRLFYLALVLLTIVISGFIPLLVFVPPVLTALLAGYDLIDLPLALTGMRLRERLAVAKGHLLVILGLGGVFMLFLLIPLGGVLFLPVAYFAAVEKISGWQKVLPKSSPAFVDGDAG